MRHENWSWACVMVVLMLALNTKKHVIGESIECSYPVRFTSNETNRWICDESMARRLASACDYPKQPRRYDLIHLRMRDESCESESVGARATPIWDRYGRLRRALAKDVSRSD
jgi:hypothetical protein